LKRQQRGRFGRRKGCGEAGVWRGRHGGVLGVCVWQAAAVCGRQRRCARAAGRAGPVMWRARARRSRRDHVGVQRRSGRASSRRWCGAEVGLGARSSGQRPSARAGRRPGDVAVRRDGRRVRERAAGQGRRTCTRSSGPSRRRGAGRPSREGDAVGSRGRGERASGRRSGAGRVEREGAERAGRREREREGEEKEKRKWEKENGKKKRNKKEGREIKRERGRARRR